MLDVLDKELERRGHRFVRGACPRAAQSADPWADDCNIYVQSRRAGERVMASVERFLTSHLKLKVNSAKSAVARPAARKFLGFSFTGEAEPRRRIAPQALARLTSRVRVLTRRTVGVSLEQAIDRLSIYLTGWRGYFGFCQTPELLRNLEGWVRRRLRCLAWVQWRTGRRRYTALRQQGSVRRSPPPPRRQRTGTAPGGSVGTRPPSRSVQRLLRRRRSSHPGAGRRMMPPPNRRVRTRTHGGAGGVEPRGFPLSRSETRQCSDSVS
jgi:hypothetical protein